MTSKVFRLTDEVKKKRNPAGLISLLNSQLNFITPNVSDKDIELFFTPEDEEEFIIIESHWTMAHVMFHSEVFTSVSNARKNGWNKPIPAGFTNMTDIGKRNSKSKKKDITLLNFPTMQEGE